MFLGSKPQTRVEKVRGKNGVRMKTVHYHEYWLVENKEVITDHYAQTDDYYTDMTFYEIQQGENGTELVEVPRG